MQEAAERWAVADLTVGSAGDRRKGDTMNVTTVLGRFVEALTEGDRQSCRALIREMVDEGLPVRRLYDELLWPAMEQVAQLYKEDRIDAAAEHMATRIVRAVADQVQMHLAQRERNGQRILILCADGEPEELGAQMCADLFEADGWETFFVGGGVPDDEVLTLVGRLGPDVLLIFGTQPAGVVPVRRLIHLIREVGAHPSMNILISGGVFNRAEGLWEEVHADLFAPTVREALTLAEQAPPRVPQVCVPGAPKKRRRRRRPPLLAQAEAAGVLIGAGAGGGH